MGNEEDESPLAFRNFSPTFLTAGFRCAQGSDVTSVPTGLSNLD